MTAIEARQSVVMLPATVVPKSIEAMENNGSHPFSKVRFVGCAFAFIIIGLLYSSLSTKRDFHLLIQPGSGFPRVSVVKLLNQRRSLVYVDGYIYGIHLIIFVRFFMSNEGAWPAKNVPLPEWNSGTSWTYVCKDA